MQDYRVAVVAPPWYPVPPVGYGGIELVVDLLVTGLKKRGVDVVLYACEGSRSDATMLAPASWAKDLAQFDGPYREAAYLGRVIEDLRTAGVDLIHDHAWALSSPLVFSLTGIPTVHTAHGPISDAAEQLYNSVSDSVGLISISDAQRVPAPNLNWIGTVHNAVDVRGLRRAALHEKGDYLVVLARISPEKGQHVAIEVAKRTGRRLIMAGKVGERDEEVRYFKEMVEPHIDGANIVYVENVAGREKADLLAKAYALLAPVQWPEPFGLSMVEAMVSGTPVVAHPLGATVELVEPAVTGFLTRDVDAMVSALSLVGDIDPRLCAEHATERFSPQVMADRYITLYEQTLQVQTGLGTKNVRVSAA